MRTAPPPTAAPSPPRSPAAPSRPRRTSVTMPASRSPSMPARSTSSDAKHAPASESSSVAWSPAYRSAMPCSTASVLGVLPLRLVVGAARRAAGRTSSRMDALDARHADPPTKVRGVDFAPSPRAADLTARVRAFIDDGDRAGRARLPRRPRAHAAPRRRGPVAAAAADRGAQGQGPRARACGTSSSRSSTPATYAERFGTHGGEGLTNVDYAPIAEQMGRSPPRAVRLQLQRPRHRQHGGAAQVRHRRAEGASGSSRCSTAGSARRSR